MTDLPAIYDIGALRLTAIHEAGHAVAYLLLGHHVISTGFNIVDNGDGTATASAVTTQTAINATALANLVGTAAGEVAVRRILHDEGHPDAATQARDTGVHDREHVQQLLGAAPSLPAHIGPAVADLLLAEHWDAVQRVAGAICASPTYRLDADDVLTAAALGDAEITWDQLSDMARSAAPDNWGVEAYLFGPGAEDEDGRAEFLAQLWSHGLLGAPATALRRQVHAETYRRGLSALKAELAAVSTTSFGGA